jgi:DNA-binding transcriptional LysR family regulator
VELRHLEYFLAVAEEEHFTRAAERLHVAQSGLSASIRALERELGAPLFARSTRRVALTEAGRALLVEARRTLASVAAARNAVAAVQGLLRGTVSIGTEQCLAVIDLPTVLSRFRTVHPGVEIRLRQAGSTGLVEEVRSGGLDLLDFVAEDLGVALVPRPIAHKKNKNVRAVPLRETAPAWVVSVAVPVNGPANPATDALLGIVEESASAHVAAATAVASAIASTAEAATPA